MLSGLTATAQIHVAILLTFLQTDLWDLELEDLTMFKRTMPWVDLAAFLGRGPRVSSNYTQSEKLNKSSTLPEDWAVRGRPDGVAWATIQARILGR